MDAFDDTPLSDFPDAQTLKRPPIRGRLRVAPTWQPPPDWLAVWEAVAAVEIPKPPKLPTGVLPTG